MCHTKAAIIQMAVFCVYYKSIISVKALYKGSLMRILSKILFVIIFSAAPLSAGWFLPEGIDQAGKEIAELAKRIKDKGLIVTSDPEMVKAIHEFNTNLDSLNKTLQNSALTTDNLNKFRLSCAYTFVGLCFSSCGIKLLYDACRDLHEKLNDKENEELAWHEIVDWRDMIIPLLGIINLGIGYKIITES